MSGVLPVYSPSSPVFSLPLKGPFIPSEKNGDKYIGVLFIYTKTKCLLTPLSCIVAGDGELVWDWLKGFFDA